MIFSGVWPLRKWAVNLLLDPELPNKGHTFALSLFWANLIAHHADSSLFVFAGVCSFAGLHPMVLMGYADVTALEQWHIALFLLWSIHVRCVKCSCCKCLAVLNSCKAARVSTFSYTLSTKLIPLRYYLVIDAYIVALSYSLNIIGCEQLIVMTGIRVIPCLLVHSASSTRVISRMTVRQLRFLLR